MKVRKGKPVGRAAGVRSVSRPAAAAQVIGRSVTESTDTSQSLFGGPPHLKVEKPPDWWNMAARH